MKKLFLLLTLLSVPGAYGMEQEDGAEATEQSLDEQLLEALKKCDVSAVRVFIKQGVDVDSHDANGWTLLHRAAFFDTIQGEMIKEALLAEKHKKNGMPSADSRERVLTLLALIQTSSYIPLALQKNILIYAAENIFSVDMLVDLLFLADELQVSHLIGLCPRKLLVEASVRVAPKIRRIIIEKTIECALAYATERCTKKTLDGTSTLAYEFVINPKLKKVLHPDGKELRAQFIREQITREFNPKYMQDNN